MSFTRTDALPIEWQFDTGWIPQDSPLQVHLLAGVYAHTTIELNGVLLTEWPPALTLSTPGDPTGGSLSYHYGLEVTAEGKVTISIAGQTYDWTGDIPFVPQVDFQVEASETFDAWGWAPGFTSTTSTETVRLAKVGLSTIIGPWIPGIDGGFELDVALDVSVTYINDRIIIAEPQTATVSGGHITSADDDTDADYFGGPSATFDVHPKGTAYYDGVLHLIPAFYVELLGQKWSIPVADYPMAFPFTETTWVFDAQRVLVPLPDLVIDAEQVDFAAVTVGQQQDGLLNLHNDGLVPLNVTLAVDDPEHFGIEPTTLLLDPEQTAELSVSFSPSAGTSYDGKLTITSNDPDRPVLQIPLLGQGVAAAEPNQPVGTAGGCGCRTASFRSTSSYPLFVGFLPLALGFIVRRRFR